MPIICTLRFNYFHFITQGHPYMESLSQNKSLLYGFIGIAAVILGLCGFVPDLAAQFEIVEFPNDVST